VVINENNSPFLLTIRNDMFKNNFLAIFLFFTEFVNYFYEFNMNPHERGYYIEKKNLFFIINLLLKITDILRVLNDNFIIGEKIC